MNQRFDCTRAALWVTPLAFSTVAEDLHGIKQVFSEAALSRRVRLVPADGGESQRVHKKSARTKHTQWAEIGDNLRFFAAAIL